MGGGQSIIRVRSAREIFGLRPLFEVQRSLVAIEGTTAVSSKEMVENVHNCRFSRLF